VRSRHISATFSSTAQRLGIVSGAALALLGFGYVVVLAAGFASIGSAAQVIPDPMFTILELLILMMAPAMIALMAAVHAWALMLDKVLGLVSLAFMTATAVLTSCVHFAILTLSRHAKSADWSSAVLSFEWPSLAYTIDILAWDLFFPLSMLFGAFIFKGSPLAMTVRILMLAAGCLALAGLAGVAVGDMRVRNIGIVGYAGVFPVIAALLALLFRRTRVA
jgi:hypothetical protein